MSATLLTNHEHSGLLEKLNRMPYGEAIKLRQGLEELYGKYNEQIMEIFETISAYEEIADRIKLRTDK